MHDTNALNLWICLFRFLSMHGFSTLSLLVRLCVYLRTSFNVMKLHTTHEVRMKIMVDPPPPWSRSHWKRPRHTLPTHTLHIQPLIVKTLKMVLSTSHIRIANERRPQLRDINQLPKGPSRACNRGVVCYWLVKSQSPDKFEQVIVLIRRQMCATSGCTYLSPIA